MTKIKIIDKAQGSGLMRLLAEPWEKLSLLDNGSFCESADEIEFRTTEGLKVTADKSDIFLENEEMTSYLGCMEETAGPQMLIDKLKSKNGCYVLRSFYPGSFFLILTIDSHNESTQKLPFIIHEVKVPTKSKPLLYGRKVEIEYLKSNIAKKNEPEIVRLARQAAMEYQSENPSKARGYLVKIYGAVIANPEQLYDVSDFRILGKSFLLMLDLHLTDDLGTLKTMAGVGYLCLSKAMEGDRENLNLYTDRLLLLRMGHDPLKQTAISAGNINLEGLSPFSKGNLEVQARDAIYRMEIADLALHPELYRQIYLFNERKKWLDEKLNDGVFPSDGIRERGVRRGVENHKNLFHYLVRRTIEEGDVDF